MRLGWLAGVACVASCWSTDDTINGFTADQWTTLSRELAFPPPTTKNICFLDGISPDRCQYAWDLGKQLFEDPGLSLSGTVSCKTCHSGVGMIDTRQPNATSLGVTEWTSRNAMSVLNQAYKLELAPHPGVFTWSGKYSSPGQVLELARMKPFGYRSQDDIINYVKTNPTYEMLYFEAFAVSASNASVDFGGLEKMLDVYLAWPADVATPNAPSTVLPTKETPFDLWREGRPSSMSDSAKRGFTVFVGKGGCIECHSGPLLSDLDFHNTGVPDNGGDVGRLAITKDAADTGKFLTGTLRDITSTGPYMHNGSLKTLSDVIAFYRRGGDAAIGTRDPRITPLDLTDDDASDLEAFLGSLTDCDDDKSCGNGPMLNCVMGVCAP
jgi:cytochrome c peroxidase